ncbi:farnesol dehydrogenase-like [Photinus pyralis]|uniref:farnesol dehydrogenase-like n=1 Tax=Photinus pyralis TaxID=7054 RepID=UPI001267433D|nr:farnesol dehydrogenase-like [Photinus pyralis]
MERWKDKVAVVTGASSGIGEAICKQLVAHGLKVVGLARRKHLIERNAEKLQGEKGKLYALCADLCKEEDILHAFDWIAENLGSIAILVNSAGIVHANSLLDGETKAWKETFDTNVLGPCIATREAVKLMRRNNIDGHIVHINSLSGHRVYNFPNMNVYQATKHAITALTETLRQELVSQGSKIRVSSISPGSVRTDFMKQSSVPFPEEIFEMLKQAPTLDPKDIADAVCYVLSAPPHVQIHELIIKPTGEML